MYNFISFGEVLIDFISKDYVDGLKNATSFDKFLGGSPSNIAVNISKQGFRSAIISKVGNDPFGNYILNELNKYKVDTSFIIQDNLVQTDLVYVLKSKTSPEFYPYRSASLNLEFLDSSIKKIADTNIFHFSSWAISSDINLKNTLKLLKSFKKSRTLVGFDPNYRKILWHTSLEIEDVLKLVLPYVDFIKPSLDDCYHIFEKNTLEEEFIKIFHDFGVKNVILTLGENGFIISTGTDKRHFESFAKDVVDTTGAGDAFWSGLYVGIINGLNIVNSSKLGNAFAAEKLKSVGAISEIKSYQTLLKEYNIV